MLEKTDTQGTPGMWY